LPTHSSVELDNSDTVSHYDAHSTAGGYVRKIIIVTTEFISWWNNNVWWTSTSCQTQHRTISKDVTHLSTWITTTSTTHAALNIEHYLLYQ